MPAESKTSAVLADDAPGEPRAIYFLLPRSDLKGDIPDIQQAHYDWNMVAEPEEAERLETLYHSFLEEIIPVLQAADDTCRIQSSGRHICECDQRDVADMESILRAAAVLEEASSSPVAALASRGVLVSHIGFGPCDPQPMWDLVTELTRSTQKMSPFESAMMADFTLGVLGDTRGFVALTPPAEELESVVQSLARAEPSSERWALGYWTLMYAHGSSDTLRARALAHLQSVPCESRRCPLGYNEEGSEPGAEPELTTGLAQCVLSFDVSPGRWELPASGKFEECASAALGATVRDPVDLTIVLAEPP